MQNLPLSSILHGIKYLIASKYSLSFSNILNLVESNVAKVCHILYNSIKFSGIIFGI